MPSSSALILRQRGRVGFESGISAAPATGAGLRTLAEERAELEEKLREPPPQGKRRRRRRIEMDQMIKRMKNEQEQRAQSRKKLTQSGWQSLRETLRRGVESVMRRRPSEERSSSTSISRSCAGMSRKRQRALKRWMRRKLRLFRNCQHAQ